MGNPVIVEALRTPIGKRRGAFAGVKPMSLLASVQRGVIERAGIDPALVEQVIGGVVTQGGEQANHLARYAWLYAGLPYQTGGTTVDAQCGSSQQAAHLIAGLIAADVIDVGVACGVESMSRVSFGEASGGKSGVPTTGPSTPATSSPAPSGSPTSRGLTREELDELGLRSQQLARAGVGREPFRPRDPADRRADPGRGGQAHRRDPHRQPRRGPA